jgi:imidazolonepropionase-like amidohydrolase
MDRNRVLERHTVIVRDGRIAEVGPSGRTPVPAGATLVDGRGKFLMPGLGDAHAHLSIPGGGAALAERALTLYALNGVTMVRSMYTEPHHRDVRDRIERGELIGPRTVIVSPALHGGNAQTPQAARDSVRKFKADGYRVVKILPGIPREAFDTLAAEARAAGMPLVGHVASAVGLEGALARGYASVEHLDGFLEAMAPPDSTGTPRNSGFFGFALLQAVEPQRMARLVQMTKASGAAVVPTEMSMEMYASADSAAVWVRRPEMQYVPRQLLDQWSAQKSNFARNAGVTAENASQFRTLRRRLIRELHAAGVPLALGSDAFTMFGVPGFATFVELEIFVASGLTAFDALASSTKEVAKLLRMENVTGTIAVGSVADLVLLDANPLEDIRHVGRQAGVMLRGSWLPRAEIERRLAALAQ